ncbi:6-pyruvoyl-tetrahydropterin synthase-related protein [Liquorilactobacillus sicerae]|uniref:6-pyruvoyl-tetrahydropterin synthase-related protein n=1 Tax=Liquorilactobacillus sicerae TaxID=1416943 RepID=UPI00248050C5|nr:6-pyruvoyl-tetrahydropterin synthase-related protein [Liquorilactobacillus sicerae]
MLKKYKLKTKIWDLLVCFIASIVVLFPYFHSGVLHSGVDMSFHLSRVYDLEQNLKHGYIFSYLSTYSFNQLGMPINMVYGFLPLYPLAVGTLLLKNPVTGIYLGIWCIVFASMLISYWIGKKFWVNNRQKSLIFSFIYVLSAYNFSWLFKTFDLGQASGYVFLPMVVYGTYSIFYREKKEWYLLALGMTAVIYCHILSVMMYSVVVFLLLIIAAFTAKRFFENLRYVILAVIFTLFTTSFFWVNLITVYSKTDILTTKLGGFSSAGTNLGDAFLNALNNNGSIGPMIFIITIIGFILWKKQNVEMRIIGIIGTTFFVATTTIFDFAWNFLTKTPVVMLQWPGRLLCISNFFLSIFVTETFFRIIKNLEESSIRYYVLLISVSLLSISGTYTFLNTSLNQDVINYAPSLSKQLPFSNYQVNSKRGYLFLVKGFNTGVGSIDYWPRKAVKYANDLRNHEAILNNRVIKINPLSVHDGVIYKINIKKVAKKIDLPFLNYNLNYTITVNGKKVSSFETKRGSIGLIIHRGENTVKIVYKPTILTRLVMMINWISIFMLLLVAWLARFKKNSED